MRYRRTYQYLETGDVKTETVFLMNFVVNDEGFNIDDVPLELTPALECSTFPIFFGLKEDGTLVLTLEAKHFLHRLISYSDESVTTH